MDIEIVRVAYLRTCTFGVLRVGDLVLETLERPWIENPAGPGGVRRESCVPDGKYDLIPHSSQTFPDTYALINRTLGVYYQPFEIPQGQRWGRSAILIHAGNFVSDVIGCIAVGMRRDEKAQCLVDSRVAMNKLRSVLGRDKHSLMIRPIAGTKELMP
jgi:hypothetical protein